MIQPPTSWYMSEGNEIIVTKRYLHTQVYQSILHNGQYMETIYMSADK